MKHLHSTFVPRHCPLVLCFTAPWTDAAPRQHLLITPQANTQAITRNKIPSTSHIHAGLPGGEPFTGHSAASVPPRIIIYQSTPLLPTKLTTGIPWARSGAASASRSSSSLRTPAHDVYQSTPLITPVQVRRQGCIAQDVRPNQRISCRRPLRPQLFTMYQSTPLIPTNLTPGTPWAGC